jgi:hypothetical protein
MIQPLLIEWLQSSRWDGAIFLMIPGTSCLATIVLSLRDKTIRSSKRSCQPARLVLTLLQQSKRRLIINNQPADQSSAQGSQNRVLFIETADDRHNVF